MTDLELGFLVGLLTGEGHFGGDAKNPQVTLRMHVRHEDLLRKLVTQFPRSKLYGPYSHGGRNYFQWMVRGPFLREFLPMIYMQKEHLGSHVCSRIEAMAKRYDLDLGV